MTFAELPIELYEAILFYVPSRDLQYTILSISRALPLSPVPLHDLFRSIRITRPEQAVHLYRRLRLRNRPTLKPNLNGLEEATQDMAASWIREVFIESWSVDADVVLNLIKLIPRLGLLNLWIGPNNFTPEHLEELFEKPIPELIYLSLRFRPYVQKANYYQFLKGAYFDSTLIAISRWPPSALTTISIVQDPVPPEEQSRPAFAQPIVFFRLQPSVSTLIHSESLSSSLTSVRLRVPLRPIASALCLSASVPLAPDAPPLSIPRLEFIDLSTSAVLEQEIDTFSVHFKTLKHLILDGCGLSTMREGEWSAIGKRCALAGVQRAREREKTLKTWLETWLTAATVGNDDVLADAAADLNIRSKKPRRGRRGLATATISLRSLSPDAASPSRPSFANRSTEIPKIRILPPLPTLTTLSMTASSIKPDVYPVLITEFEAGWAEGVAQLAVTRARFRASASNGVRVVRFMEGNESNSRDGGREGFEGLEDINKDDQAAFDMPVETGDGRDIYRAPVLCLAGDAEVGHREGCGHAVASRIWVG